MVSYLLEGERIDRFQDSGKRHPDPSPLTLYGWENTWSGRENPAVSPVQERSGCPLKPGIKVTPDTEFRHGLAPRRRRSQARKARQPPGISGKGSSAEPASMAASKVGAAESVRCSGFSVREDAVSGGMPSTGPTSESMTDASVGELDRAIFRCSAGLGIPEVAR